MQGKRESVIRSQNISFKDVGTCLYPSWRRERRQVEGLLGKRTSGFDVPSWRQAARLSGGASPAKRVCPTRIATPSTTPTDFTLSHATNFLIF